jgi:hypothetical protein
MGKVEFEMFVKVGDRNFFGVKIVNAGTCERDRGRW